MDLTDNGYGRGMETDDEIRERDATIEALRQKLASDPTVEDKQRLKSQLGQRRESDFRELLNFDLEEAEADHFWQFPVMRAARGLTTLFLAKKILEHGLSVASLERRGDIWAYLHFACSDGELPEAFAEETFDLYERYPVDDASSWRSLANALYFQTDPKRRELAYGKAVELNPWTSRTPDEAAAFLAAEQTKWLATAVAANQADREALETPGYATIHELHEMAYAHEAHWPVVHELQQIIHTRINAMADFSGEAEPSETPAAIDSTAPTPL